MTERIARKDRSTRSQNASLRVTTLFLALAVTLVAAGTWWVLHLKRSNPSSPLQPAPEPVADLAASPLSEATRAVLGRLQAPIQIRYYAILSETIGPARTFARRLDRLLSEYERAGAGHITVTRGDSAEAALRDGLEPIRLPGGDVNFLGMVIIGPDQRAVLPRLAAEWEAAAEFDLSRAIARAAGGAATAEMALNPPPTSPVVAADVTEVLPDVQSLSLEEARAKLRDAGRRDFEEAALAFKKELDEAQSQLAAAQQAGGPAEAAAQQNLQALRNRQAERLREISQRWQARQAALEQLKRTP